MTLHYIDEDAFDRAARLFAAIQDWNDILRRTRPLAKKLAIRREIDALKAERRALLNANP